MKLTADLRAAVRAASRLSQNNARLAQHKEKTSNREAADAFLKTKKGKVYLAKFQRVQALNDEATKLQKEAEACGIEVYLHYTGGSSVGVPSYYLRDPQKFVAAGGELPEAVVKSFTEEQVLGELATVQAKDAPAVLAKFGIIWE